MIHMCIFDVVLVLMFSTTGFIGIKSHHHIRENFMCFPFFCILVYDEKLW